ncbi:hypothetical protein [Brevundimonas sp.]|uniref:hypothetical protein n=1 Tax=Brevundimonas sp. TaxID=1871086 RepID=UPI001D7C3D6D|nr:hypothetical protein [Brevundimonas sp.]MBL0948212.1 hypothetical protein [Brevundimonas sp.]
MNRSLAAAAALMALAITPACAPVVEGGPPLALPPGLVETASIGTITLSTGWLRAEDDVGDTFIEEIGEEMRTCAYGTWPLDLRLHIEELDREGRLTMAVRGRGSHYARGVAELVDPRSGTVVGRYPLEVEVDAGGRVAGIFGDRQMIVAEAFGRALCDAAFARNPRRPGPHNATPN